MDVQIDLLSTPEDIEQIIELQTRCLRVINSQDYTPRQIESLVTSQKSARFGNEIIVVAKYDQKIVGFACLSVSAPIIGGLYVAPDFCRRGIGSNLLAEIENIAIEKKYKNLYVNSSVTAVAFYQRNSYKKLVNLGFYAVPKVWVEAFLMNKELIPQTNLEKALPILLFVFLFLVLVISIIR